jgi:hypothetical protein
MMTLVDIHMTEVLSSQLVLAQVLQEQASYAVRHERVAETSIPTSHGLPEFT